MTTSFVACHQPPWLCIDEAYNPTKVRRSCDLNRGKGGRGQKKTPTLMKLTRITQAKESDGRQDRRKQRTPRNFSLPLSLLSFLSLCLLAPPSAAPLKGKLAMHAACMKTPHFREATCMDDQGRALVAFGHQVVLSVAEW